MKARTVAVVGGIVLVLLLVSGDGSTLAPVVLPGGDGPAWDGVITGRGHSASIGDESWRVVVPKSGASNESGFDVDNDALRGLVERVQQLSGPGADPASVAIVFNVTLATQVAADAVREALRAAGFSNVTTEND